MPFFQHMLPHWLRDLFCLPALTAGELGLTSLDGAELASTAKIYPQLAVVPMGWSWGLHVVQKVHEGILDCTSSCEVGRRAVDFAPLPS